MSQGRDHQRSSTERDHFDKVVRLVNTRYCVRLTRIARKVDQQMDAEQRDFDEAETARSLVQRVGTGDAEAESELAQRYGERLRYVLNRQMAQYSHDVEDIVQESLTTVILNLRERQIDNPAQLGGYIYGIARNLRLMRIRDHAKHDGDVNPDVISAIPDEQLLPDQLIASCETTQTVRQLLAELGTKIGTKRDREVLLRLYLHQQTKEEVCEALEIPAAHLRRVVHRAKQRLRQLLDSRGTDSAWEAADE